MNSPIAVLGAGAWGTALSLVLARNGNTVFLWDVDTQLIQTLQTTREHPARLTQAVLPDNITPVTELSEAVHNVRDICLVVPSFAFNSVLTSLQKIVPHNVRFVWGTKGLNPDNGGFLHEIIAQFYPDSPMAVLSGPSFANETAHDIPTMVTLASKDHSFLKELATRFNSATFKVDFSDDLIGVQLCGVLKNVLAIATGIVDGMQYGTNTRCALITKGLEEMSHLCVALKGKKETVMSLAGVGDLILTCTDNQSRNRRLGLAIGSKQPVKDALKSVGESVEGYYNAQQLNALAEKHQVSAPLIQCVHKVLFQQAEVQSLIQALMNT